MIRFLRVAIALLGIGSALARDTPADAALGFLRAVSSGNATEHPEEHTALSKSLDPDRRREIVRQLHLLRSNIEPDHLAVLEEKVDGDLAAVLVRQQVGHDVASFQIHPVALLRVDQSWLAAPLPASFDGTGLAFRASLLPRARALEGWMLDARGRLLANAQDEVRQSLETAMRQAIPADFLTKSTPEAIVERFITAAGERDVPAMLALLGGLHSQLPRDYESQSLLVIRLFRPNARLPFAWNLVTSPHSLRTIVHSEQNSRSAIVTVACLNPLESLSATLKPFALHFPLIHTPQGSWHLNLPQTLRTLPANPSSPPEESVIDGDLLHRMPERLARQFPTQPSPTAAAARDAWIEALRAPTPKPLLALLQPADPPSLDPLLAALDLWSGLHKGPGVHAPLPLHFEETAEEAGLLLQLFSTSRPGLNRIHLIRFTRGPGGWLGAPAKDPKTSPLTEKLLKLSVGFRKTWSIRSIPRIPLLPQAPDPETSRRLFDDWLKSCAGLDLVRLLALATRLEDDESILRSLRSLSQHLSPKPEARILSVHRHGRWTAASVTFGENVSIEPFLLLAAQTAEGPKVLLSVLLKANPDPEADPGRAYLNREALNFIRDKVDAEASDELDHLLQLHHKAIQEEPGKR